MVVDEAEGVEEEKRKEEDEKVDDGKGTANA